MAGLVMRTALAAALLGAALLAGMAANSAIAATEGASATDVDTNTSIHRIRGFLPDLRFSLQGPENKILTENDFHDKVVLLFFGYASCPDICPTTLAQLSHVLHELGNDASKAQIVFISVDPHRDTPEVLQAYVSAFDERAVGLTGNEREIADIARRYRVAYQIEAPSGDDTQHYDVTHGRGIYIFDQQGRARFLASDSDSVATLVQHVRELLD